MSNAHTSTALQAARELQLALPQEIREHLLGVMFGAPREDTSVTGLIVALAATAPPTIDELVPPVHGDHRVYIERLERPTLL